MTLTSFKNIGIKRMEAEHVGKSGEDVYPTTDLKNRIEEFKASTYVESSSELDDNHVPQ